MAVSPKDLNAESKEIRRIYERAELEIIQIIARALRDGEDGPQWAMQKLSLIADILRQSQQVTGKLNKTVPKELERVINLAYTAGNASAAADLEAVLLQFENDPENLPDEIQMKLFPDGFPENKINVETTMATFTAVNTEAVAALAGATTGRVTGLHVPVVRAVDDGYKRIVTRSVGSAVVGSLTRLETTQNILNEFTESGFKLYIDKAGNRREIATYAEMATRAAIAQASLQGHMDQMQSYGFDLVQISNHHEECELCRPWEGKILSVSGDDPNYDSLADATRAGLFHPNCGHRANTYFEGLTKPLEETEDAEGYEIRQRQRYLERGIREWKKRGAAALTPETDAYTLSKIAEWEARLVEHTTVNDRRRKREREQNVRAR